MTGPPTATVTSEDILTAATICRRVLLPAAELDWDRPAGDLEWSCRTTLAHVLSALLFYAINLATCSTEERHSGLADPSLPIAELVDALEGRAALLAAVCDAAPPGARGTHEWGRADAPGFAALACDEMLVHTSDIATGLGTDFDPPRDLCARVLARLFPWAPSGEYPWAVLLWANGRTAMGDRTRVGPNWVGHPAPLDEWDGSDPSVSA